MAGKRESRAHPGGARAVGYAQAIARAPKQDGAPAMARQGRQDRADDEDKC